MGKLMAAKKYFFSKRGCEETLDEAGACAAVGSRWGKVGKL